jgi:RNA polymerase sigma-70 factor (ECF subfamily)
MDSHPPATESRDVDVEIGRAWRDNRRHLLDIAFRMLGNLNEAEDAVQEAFTRLVRGDVDRIDNVGGWLVVVVSRLCLDKLRDRRRHPLAPDQSLGDRPADHAVDPADRITLDDNVRIALHLVPWTGISVTYSVTVRRRFGSRVCRRDVRGVWRGRCG